MKFLAGKWVALLYRSTQMHINGRIAQDGIGAGQYPFLLYIGRCSGCSQEEIAKALCFDKGTTARAIRKLEEAGYVMRQVSADDHRRNEVYITPKGAKKRLKVRKMLEEWHEEIFSGISKEEKMQTMRILEKMAFNSIQTRNNISHVETQER